MIQRIILRQTCRLAEKTIENSKVNAMEGIYRRLARSGAQDLTIGILTLIFGVTVGVLNIVNGGKLLRQRRELK